MTDYDSAHMDLETFRQNAYKAVDWVVDYLAGVEAHPVLSQVSPGDIAARLPGTPPRQGESFDAMLADMNDIVLPGITHWQSPNFFAYFPCNGSGPALLGEILSSGLGVQGMLWATSPACTEIETRVMDWLVHLLDLPETYLSSSEGGGVIQHSASDATLCALLAARERASGGETNRKGGDRQMVAYTSAHAHSSIEKACMIAGIGTDNLRLVPVDEHHRMRPEALNALIEADIAAGLQPFFVCACVGTTSSLALDDIAAVAEVSAKHKLWLHVDAAMAGTAAVCPEFRFINAGVDRADSYTFNPHKWMFTTFDCNAFFVKDRQALISALSILPEYLRNAATDSGEVFDYRDWHVPLGRRFRALKLWFVLRHYGSEGLQQEIREHIRLAQWFREQVEQSEIFELAVENPLNLVCFRHVKGDAASEATMHALNDSGQMYLTHTRLDDRFTLRMSIGGTWTRESHVRLAWERLVATALGQ